MELVAGYPYWLIKSGLPYQYPKLSENKKCQVLIIGGGISGALTAYYCTNAGIECILIDGRSIGLGSTCASTALLQYELDIPLHKLKKLVGVYNATRAYQLCGEAIDKLLDIMLRIGFTDFSKRNSLYFSDKRNEKEMLKAELLARDQAGFHVDLVTGDDLLAKFGLKARAGIYSTKGASCNAYLFTHEILQYCRQKGLQVFDRTKVKLLQSENNRLTVETSEGFTVQCSYIVNATGYEVVNFINKRIVDLDCTYATVSDSIQENNALFQSNTMMWSTNNPYSYLCPTNDNRVMIGGKDEPFVHMRTMHKYLERKTDALVKDFRKHFPSIQFKKEFAWSGVFGKTRDSLPYIGAFPKDPRMMYALGFGGNGITFSQVAAEIITDLLLGKQNRDASVFSFNRST